MEIGRSELRKLDSDSFWWRVRNQDVYSECVSGVKIKTVLLKSNIFFPILALTSRIIFSLRKKETLETLLGKGFKLFVRSFECFFFFSVEPPLGCRFLHQGIDMPHAHEIPDAF